MKPRCIVCGRQFPCREAAVKRAGLRWRTAIGRMDPLGEWYRQEMPTSGFSRRDIDSLTINRISGEAGLWEISSTRIDNTKFTDIEAARRAVGPFAVRLERDDQEHANVPSAIHYPQPCDDCGMPEQPVVADRIWVQGPNRVEHEVTVDALKRYMLAPHLWWDETA